MTKKCTPPGTSRFQAKNRRIGGSHSPLFHHLDHSFWLLASLLALSGLVAETAGAFPIVQEWYVPQPEAQVREDYLVLAPKVNAISDSVIAVTIPIAGTTIVYDHWEDGYEVDLGNPSQSTTVIWGDGNDANGKPPGYASDPSSFSAGSLVLMRNDVPLPRNAATILFDGRDRIGSTYGIVMTRAAWFTNPGPLLAESVEVRGVPDWGTSFLLPVGEDLIFPTPVGSSMFEHCSAYIMAAQNGTVVTIDRDGSGPEAAGAPITLNQGESYLVNSGIKKGATIMSTKVVQVMEFYGDVGANYESRGANIPPLEKWSDDYYAPVGTASDGDDTYVFLYNPDSSAAISINYTTKVSSGSFSIPPHNHYQFLMPQDSAARFKSAGAKPFWGVAAVGAEPSVNNVHDWGYSLVPKDFLSTEIAVGWGAGSSDGTQNGSPVWVTSTGATRIYVDYNGDRNGANTDPSGQKYDIHLDVAPLTVSRIYESDKDQSAMRLYTLDGTRITGAWGQDPAVAGPAMPYLDLGNTLPNFPVPVMTKVSSLVVDNNTPGLSVGDVLEYTITLDNQSLFSLAAVNLVDALPTTYVSYVASTTTRDGNAVSDAGTTAFPLDEGGLVIPILLSKDQTVIKFRVMITASGTVTNTATLPGYPGVQASDTVVVPVGAGSSICTLFLTNSSGTEVNYQPGDGIYVTVTDADANTSISTVQTMAANVTNSATGDVETITLTETGVNTGVFRNTAPLPSSTSIGIGPNDGTLNVQVGNTITATHADTVFGDDCQDTALITAPSLTKQLYLDTDGSDNDTTGDLDRVDPVATSDPSLSQTSIVEAPAAAAVIAGATTSGSDTSVASGTTLSFSHTPGSGSNRLLLVSVGVGNTSLSDTAAPGTVSGVTFGGTAMTLVDSVQNDAVRSYVYQLVNPGSAAANVVITISGKTASVSASATTFTGVDQATPLGAPVAANSATDSSSLSATVASATGELVYSTAATDEGIGNQSITTSTAGGQAELVKNSGFDFVTTATSTKPGTGSVTTSYTTGDVQEWVVIAVPIKPAPGTTGGSVSWSQTPAFAEAFSMPAGGALGVTAYYTVSSGSMPASPAITAVLRKNGVAFATSSGATANAATGSGLLTFSFPTLGGDQSFIAGDVISLVITNNQSGVSFRADYDSSTTPSKITLPTNTVIHNDSLAVYDAPYPGGSVVTTPTAGQTLYIRVTAGDPFGAYDITSLPLVIDGPGADGDVSTTLTDTSVVASTAATKTYQYAWFTGSTEGTFSITATAKEGFENTITSARSTTVNISSLDLGTPSITEFTTGLNGPGTPTYATNEQVFVRITDLDQNTNPAVVETITAIVTTSGGDSELVTLTETGVNTGVFVVGIPASATVSGTSNNGTLYAPAGAALTASYQDPTDPTDTSNDAASVPSGTPGVSVVKTLLSPTDSQIVIGETAQYRLRVTNTGNTTLNTVQVVDTYPAANLTYVSATPAPSTVGSGSLTWNNVGPLTTGQSVDLVVSFTGLAAANPADNTVNVTTGGGPTASDTVSVVVTRPGVTVTKTLVSPNPGPASVGENVVYNIAVQNTGTTPLTTVPLEDIYSSALYDFVSASVTPDGSGAGSLLWTDVTGAGTLAVSNTFNVTVTLKAKGAGNPANNNAAVNYAVDSNGDSVPPSASSAGVQTIAATISGYVYEDQGAAGFGGDVAIPTTEMRLYIDPNGDGDPSDGTLVAITTTDVNGYYEFLNLGAGQYVVVEEDFLGYASTDDTQGADTDNRIAVNITTLTSYPNNNFLDDIVDPANYGSITGQVRNDTDADGSFADADSGLAGAVVTLYTDPNGDGDPSDGVPFGIPVTTTASGTYSFTNLPPGNYVVVETNPAGYVSTADISNPDDDQIPVTVVASTTSSGNDFLDTDNTAALGTIGNQIWADINNNGLLDGAETGIDGVVVELYLAGQTPGVDAPYLTTTTSGGGLYSFANVPAGNYVVYLPASNFAPGGLLATAPLSSTVTAATDNNVNNDDNGTQTASGTAVSSPTISLAAGETENTIDFGFVPTSSLGAITGAVLADTNNDNAGDTGIENVMVALYADADNDGVADTGTPVVTTTTDVNGNYTFTGVAPGSYVIVESQPAAYLNVTDADGTPDTPGSPDDVINGITSDNLIPVSLASGETDSGNDFVEEKPGTISGSVQADTDNNGSGDLPISGVLVYVDADGDNTYDAGEPSDVTDAAGLYLIDGLGSGTLSVRVDTTTLPGGTTPAYDLDGVGTPHEAAVVLASNQIRTDVDFGYQGDASIGDTVWNDADGDGVQDANELPVSGVVVFLDLDNDGVKDANEPSDTTDGSGAYSIGGLVPGTYTVALDPATIPSGATLTGDPDPTVDGKTSVTLNAGDAVTTADFGLQGDASVGDYVWNDADGDGVQDANELPMSGVVVFIDMDNDGVKDASEPSDTTDASGAYSIGGLLPGTYTVAVASTTLPSGATVTGDPDPTVDGKTSVTLNAGDAVTTADFGLQGDASLGDYVWNDADGDGVQDFGETPLTNVSVFLDRDGDGSRDANEPFSTTDGSGVYTIAGLVPGTYTVVVDATTLPGGASQTGDPDGFQDGMATVVLTAGQNVTTADFGYQTPLFSVSGQVRNDLDGDGELTDPDSGVPAVVVSLHTDPNGDGDPSDGILIASTVTNGAGNYAFTGIPDGNYTVVETNPAGATSTADAVGPNDDRIPVAVAGANVPGRDFLDTLPPGSLHLISGTVYDDGPLDDNTFSADDVAVPAVSVSLYADLDADGLLSPGIDLLVATDVTDLIGGYSFPDLPAGDYVVVETDPAGATSENDTQGAGTDNTIGVVLTNADSIANDYLDDNVLMLSISGQVRHDVDGDGDPLDPDAGVNGVVVTLHTDPNGDGNPADGVPLGSFYTALNGNYAFTSLPPGSYVVVETDPAGASSTYDPSGNPTDNSIAVTLSALPALNRDFLDTDVALAGISGYVFYDGIPDDNDFGAGDTPVAGVQVLLIADGNNNGVFDPGEPAVDVTVSSAATNGTGFYHFDNLASGNYVAVEIDPSDATSENDVEGAPLDNEIAVALAGTDITGRNFLDDGLIGGIAGTVWNDADQDGGFSAGDTPMAGVLVSLYTDPDGDGDPSDGLPVGTALTSGSGAYNFPNLATGFYVVVETDPPGAFSTGDVEGLPTDNSIAVEVNGAEVSGQDFFDAAPSLADISGFVYDDGTPDDNTFGAGDGPVAGVIVSLFKDIDGDGDGDAGEFIGATVTATDGFYSFSDLTDGTYLVVETNPSGAVSEDDTQGVNTDDKIAVTLTGTYSPGNNFLDDGVILHAIGGQVRDDLDADGVFNDPDRPLNGVTVSLFADVNGDGVADPGELIGTTITNAGGYYSFGNLPDGNYLVVETDLPNTSSTADTNAANDNLIAVTLSGADSVGNDFLDEVDPSGYIYASHNGQIIPGGSVSVSGPGNITLTQDGSNGQYGFIVDTAGIFTLTVTPPAGWIIDPTRPVAGPVLDVPPGPGILTLGSGEGTPGYLSDPSAAANPYYITLVLNPGDQLMMNNNIPLREIKSTTWSSWQYNNPLGGQNGPGQNPDGDIYGNLAEFAFCLPADSGRNRVCPLEVVPGAPGQVDALMRRIAGAQGVAYSLEYISDLANSTANGGGWTNLTTITPTVTPNPDGSETARFQNLESIPALAGGQGFVRIRAEIDEDNNPVTPPSVVRSDTCGWMDHGIATQCETCNVPFLKCEYFSGTVDSNTPTSLSIATSIGIGSFSSGLVPGRCYWAEVVAGPFEGHRWMLTAGSTATSIAVNASGTMALTTNMLQGAPIVVREAYTIGELFPPAEFQSGSNLTNSDNLLFYTAGIGWTTYFLADLSGGGLGVHWIRQGGGITSQDGLCLEACRGFYIHRRGAPLTRTFMGHVRENDFACPLVPGYNLVGSGYPLTQSAEDRAMTWDGVDFNGFVGGFDAAHTDNVIFWNGDTTPGIEAYTSYWLVDAGVDPFRRWSLSGDSSAVSQDAAPLFGADRAAFYDSTAGNPGWVMPAGWIP